MSASVCSTVFPLIHSQRPELARRDLLVLPVQAAATLLPLAVAVQSHKRTKEQEDSSQNQNTKPPNRGASLTTVLQPGSI